MANPRYLGKVYQGEHERVAYAYIATAWGTMTVASFYELRNNAGAVLSSNISGSASVNGGTVISPLVINLTAGQTYFLEWGGTISGNLLTAYLEIEAD